MDFAVFPKVLLLNAAIELPGVAAHLDDEDSLCFASPGSIVLDKYDPAGTAILVLQLAVTTLETCISGEAQSDIKTEFAQHWGQNTCFTALPDDAADGLASLVAVSQGHTAQLTVLTQTGEGLEVFPTVTQRLRDRIQEPAYLIRLDCELDLPGGKRPPNTLAELLWWAESLKPSLGTRILAAIQNRNFFKHNPTVFLLASNGWVGAEVILPPLTKLAVQRAQFQNDRMLKQSEHVRIRRWVAARFDSKFMISRNLGDTQSLGGRKIILVGCGTIGSHLARFLVQGGAGRSEQSLNGQTKSGEIWLVDPEHLMPGNIGRHLLGPRHIGRPKAQALASELLGQFPGGKIHSVVDSALANIALLTAADIVIDATGEEALSIAINSKLLALRPESPDALYVSLFANGAAAQSLFVSGKTASGACRKCMHPILGEAPHFYPIIAGWEAREVPAACGEGAFLPYGVASSAIAAGLASSMIAEWANGNVIHSLRTLRVDLQATTEVTDQSPKPFEGCPCCGEILELQDEAAAE